MGTSYVQIQGEWHIRDESRIPPGHFHLFCVVEMLFGALGKQYKLPTPLNRQLSCLAVQGLTIRKCFEINQA